MVTHTREAPEPITAPPEAMAARIGDVEVAVGLARALRQAGGHTRRIKLGIEGVLDLFGAQALEAGEARRIQDALTVAGVGVEPSLLEAEEDGPPLALWLEFERLAPPESPAAAPLAQVEAGRFEPADGRRLDRRSAQAVAALLPGLALPIVGAAVLGTTFVAAFLALALVIAAIARWKASWLSWLRWPFGPWRAGASSRVLTAGFLAVTGVLFVAGAAIAIAVPSRLEARVPGTAAAAAESDRAAAGAAARERQAAQARLATVAAERASLARALRAERLRARRRAAADRRRRARAARVRREQAAAAAQGLFVPAPAVATPVAAAPTP